MWLNGDLLLQGVNEQSRRSLQATAFVPVGNATRLIAPHRLFLRLKEDLAPFAYEVPPAFVRHVDILKQLGCRDAPTTDDLIDLLKVPLHPLESPCHSLHFPH